MKTCLCPEVVGPSGDVGEYCDGCHQRIEEVDVAKELSDREKLLEAERLVREVIASQPAVFDSAPVIGRLRYVADSLIDLCKEVTD